MWSRRPRVVWFKLKTGGSKGFHMPIPLYIFQELLDCVLDLTALVCVFVPKPQSSGTKPSPHDVKKLLHLLMCFLDSLTENQPYELVDVTTDKVSVSIKIR